MKLRAVAALCLLSATASAQRVDAQRAGKVAAQVPAPAPAPPATVDKRGVLRWAHNGREVALFGVNYAAPFAFDYRAIKQLGVDPKRAIDRDVAHIARLGLDAFRIHVWDREVSDSAGNLLVNDHLDLLDYLIAQLSARGIKTILTPIAWWGPGYPAPDHPSPGFSNKYSKPQMAVDSVSIVAQERYVAQFTAHVNPYTTLSYRDDPDIIAFEIFNEPWHDIGTPAQTTHYINRLVASMRGTGLRKPIFYNISEHFTPEHGRAVCAANIQGVSAQWYPTGLVRGEALPGNPLLNVDRYPLPFDTFKGCRNKARMVYEFDGADVDVPVMYPAMARAFRGAGFQWATQFAYDPLAIAHTNAEYQTHYLNLVYTPAKAISFLIAGGIFRQLPRGFDAGTYPANKIFRDFHLEYALRDYVVRGSAWVSDSVFAYAGHTFGQPRTPSALRRIAGVGSSTLVQHSGTGAYFLDRLAPGVWRLEVYPDAVPVEDPYSRGSLQRTVTRIYWRTNGMGINLPDLGASFTAVPLNIGNQFTPTVRNGTLTVRPGVYLLRRLPTKAADSSSAAGAGTAKGKNKTKSKGTSNVIDAALSDEAFADSAFTAMRRVKGRLLGEFYAPPPSEGPTRVRHVPPSSVEQGTDAELRFQVVQPEVPDSVVVFVRYEGWQGFRAPQRLYQLGAYDFVGMVAADSTRTGTLQYVISVFTGANVTTYPESASVLPTAWDYTGTAQWSMRVESRATPIVLWDANRDQSRVVNTGYIPGAQLRSDWVAGSAPGRGAWLVGADAFGATAPHVAVRTMLADADLKRMYATFAVDVNTIHRRLAVIGQPYDERAERDTLAAEARAKEARTKNSVLRVRMRAESQPNVDVEVALLFADGVAWGTTIRADSAWRDVDIPLSSLRQVPVVLLPRPYPTFLPYDLTVQSTSTRIDLAQLEGVQWGFPRPFGMSNDSPLRIVIESVQLRDGPK